MKSPKLKKLFFVIALMSLTLSFAFPAQAADSLNCEDLGKPDKTKGFIITILEEKIIAPGTKEQTSNNDTQVFSCFRKTECKKLQDNTSCASQYVKECPPNQTNTMCQPVQVLLAKSGAELLYTYVGAIYRWAAGTVGIVTVLFLVVGGVQIAAAQGDSGKIEKAKERIIQSIAGLVLLFLSGLILYTINPNFFVV